MTVHELRPPCNRCGAPGLTAFCPMTDRFIVLRGELITPAARGREWLCGGCLVRAVTDLATESADEPVCARVDDQGGCGHPESRHGPQGCESAPGSLVPCWCRAFVTAEQASPVE